MSLLQRIFGGSSSIPASKARDMLLKACDNVRSAKGAGLPLRRVIAEAIHIGTKPDSPTVTTIIKEIKLGGGLPAGVEPADWWDNADKESRVKLLSAVADYLK